jgi:proline iminopeptidase
MRNLILIVVISLFYLSGCTTDQDVASKQDYVEVNNGKLYYQTFGKGGKPVIVLHGGPGLDQGYLLPQMLELAKNHEVTFYDQRGCGKSFNTPFNDQVINTKQYIEDLEALRKKLGHEKIALVGHSWGGLLAMYYAARYPNNISHLVLIGSLSPTQRGFQAFMKEYNQRMAPLKTEMDQIQSSKAFKDGDPKTVEAFCHLIFKEYFIDKKDVDKLSVHFTAESAPNVFKVHNFFVKNLFSKTYDLRKKLKKTKFPTLILHGDRDIIPVSTTKETKQAFPHAKLVVYKNKDHLLFIEAPQQFFSDLNEFLK